MKWTVLSDNRSNDERLFMEHGLSVLLETEEYKILLDTGTSDVFIRNAEQLGIDLSDVNYVFISHGHSDHAGGLCYLSKLNKHAQIIVSPLAMNGKFYSNRGHLHSITADWPVMDKGRFLWVTQTCEVMKGMNVLAHIPQIHSLPKGNQYLYMEDAEGQLKLDDFHHELGCHPP